MAAQLKAPVGASRNTLESWLASAAGMDPALRTNVLNNTHATLAQLVGRDVPSDIRVFAMEEQPTDLYIVRRFEGGTEPLESDVTQAQLLRTSIHTLAMEQEGFWEKVAANPKPVLEQTLALKLPPTVSVHVLTENANTAYLVLHHPPHLQTWSPPPAVMHKIAVKK
jgi:hypothetical protein